MLDYTKEKDILMHHTALIGIDEAGRGPWAGPVVIAGVKITKTSIMLDAIDDSKKLSAKKRELLYQQIIANHEYYTVIIENTTIDELGIGHAVIRGMNDIIKAFNAPYNLIDGYFKQGSFPKNTQCIINGDAICYSIAAASIVAKYTRDAIMEQLDIQYPEYNFKSHKGYGTKEHMEKLKIHGISPIHRRSYKPIAMLLSN